MKNTLKKTRYLSISLLILYSLSGQAECMMEDYKDTLTSEPVLGTLKRLYKEAEEADKPLLESYTMQPQSETVNDPFADILKQEERDYKGLYHRFASNYLNISPEFGQYLYTCVRSTKAKRIVEFGTSFGISTIHLAAALRDNGGGELITTELEESKAFQARKNFESAGLADLVDVRIGDALDTLKTGIKGKIDLVHLDGAFSLYLPVLKLLEPHLKEAALVIGENAVDPSYLGYVRNPKNGYHSQRIQIGEKNEYERGNELTLVTR